MAPAFCRLMVLCVFISELNVTHAATSEWSCCPPCGNGFKLRLTWYGNGNENTRVDTEISPCGENTSTCPVYAHRGCWNAPLEEIQSFKLRNNQDYLITFDATYCAMLAKSRNHTFFFIKEDYCYTTKDHNIFNRGPISAGYCDAADIVHLSEKVDMYILPDCPDTWYTMLGDSGICIAEDVEDKTYLDAETWCQAGNGTILPYNYLAEIASRRLSLTSGTYWLSDTNIVNENLRKCASFKYNLTDMFPSCSVNESHQVVCLFNDTLQSIWMDWTSWSDCNVDCGEGSQMRSRYRLSPVAADRLQVDARNCTASETCPSSSKFPAERLVWHGCWNSERSHFSSGNEKLKLNVTMGYDLYESHNRTVERCAQVTFELSRPGFLYRNRKCFPARSSSFIYRLNDPSNMCNSFGLDNATGYDSYFFITDGQTVNPNWGVWTEWSECTMSCGGGGMTRSRLCDNPGVEGRSCVGQSSQTKLCNQDPCTTQASSTLTGEQEATRITCVEVSSLEAQRVVNSQTPIPECGNLARIEGHNLFAVGPGGQCYYGEALSCNDRNEVREDAICGTNATTAALFALDIQAYLRGCEVSSTPNTVGELSYVTTGNPSSTAVDYLQQIREDNSGAQDFTTEDANRAVAALSELSNNLAITTAEEATELLESVALTLKALVKPANIKTWVSEGSFVSIAASVESIVSTIGSLLQETFRNTISIRQGSLIEIRSSIANDTDSLEKTISQGVRYSLPQESLEGRTHINIISVVYANVGQLFGDPSSSNTTTLGNQVSRLSGTVISVTSDAIPHTARLSEPAVITIPLTNTIWNDSAPSEIRCVFWNITSQVWSPEGCDTVHTEVGVDCHCNHLTSFAVLMRYTDYTPSEKNLQALKIIGYVGCSVSLCCLIISFATFVYLDNLKTERRKIHMNLIVALGLAQITHVVGIELTDDTVACTCIAALLHFFWTSTFTWMLCEGIHLYFKIVAVFNSEGRPKTILFYVIGWGLPVLIVGISLAIRLDGYGTESFCWLSMKDGLIWAFIGPVCAVSLINFIIMAIVIKIVIASAASIPAKSQKSINLIRAGVKGVIILTPILGVTWLFGLLAVNEQLLVFEFLFVIINSLQGLFIFLLHVVGSSEVRTAFQHKREASSRSKSLDRSVSKAPEVKPANDQNWNTQMANFLFRSSKSATRAKQQPNAENILKGLIQGDSIGKNLGGIRHMVSCQDDSEGTDNHAYEGPSYSPDISWTAEYSPLPDDHHPNRTFFSMVSKTAKSSNASTEMTSLDYADFEYDYEGDGSSSVRRSSSKSSCLSSHRDQHEARARTLSTASSILPGLICDEEI